MRITRGNIIGKSIRGVDVLSLDEEALCRDEERVLRGEIKKARKRYICRCHYCGSITSIADSELRRAQRRKTNSDDIGCGCRIKEHISRSRRKTNQYKYCQAEDCYIGVDCNGNEFKISPCSYDVVRKYSWVLDGRYFRTKIPEMKRTILLHRYVMFGDDIDQHSKEMIDHINGDRYDCRLQNLRVCTRSQNMMNRKRSCNNTSGVVGVRWNSVSHKWRAELAKECKRVYCAEFDNFDDAVRARHDAEILYFGEYRPQSSR